MSIFNDQNKVTSNYMKFEKIGDKVEGTYVEKRITMNTMRANTEQMVYSLKQADGTIIDVYGKPGIDAQMRNVRLGQVIGFEFVRQTPPKIAGHKPTNVIQVYANPNVVDQEWLREQEEIRASEGANPAPMVNAQPAPMSAGTVTAPSDEELLIKINNIAVSKLGATNAEEVKNKVMEVTNMAFLPMNLPKILETLEQLP